MRHKGGAPPKDAPTTAAVVAWAAPKAKKHRSVGIGDAAFLRVLDDLNSKLASGAVASLEPKHFVALYADLHFRVYGVEPIDLGSKERAFAAKLARDMLEKDFAGDAAKMAEFVSWAWSREKEREQWRRDNGRDGGRISWRFQFGRQLLADFKVRKVRADAKKGAA